MHRSHGTGEFRHDQFRELGPNCVFEPGVLVFHPENISLGSNVYVGHGSMLKGYYQSEMRIGDGTWIGQMCFFHSAGGLYIGAHVGVGPGVKIITSVHEEPARDVPIIFAPLVASAVHIEDGSDVGTGTVVLPGVRIGRGAIIGAGAVVATDIPDYAVAAGVPARVLRLRS